MTNLRFFVNLIDDATAERDETVHLRLSNLQNASPGPRMEADLLIRDDDGPPILASAKLGTNNHFNLTFTGKIGQPFRVDASTNLPAWFLIARLTNTTGTLEYTDPTPAIGPRRFYRTALLP